MRDLDEDHKSLTIPIVRHCSEQGLNLSSCGMAM